MKHAWVIRLLVGSTLAVAAPILGIADVSAQVGTDDTFRITIAAATARNPRNSESDIIFQLPGRDRAVSPGDSRETVLRMTSYSTR